MIFCAKIQIIMVFLTLKNYQKSWILAQKLKFQLIFGHNFWFSNSVITLHKLIFNRLKYSKILGKWNQRTKWMECTRRKSHFYWLRSHFFEGTSRLHSILHNVDSFINHWDISLCHVGGIVHQDLLSYEKIQSTIENYGYSSCFAYGHFR